MATTPTRGEDLAAALAIEVDRLSIAVYRQVGPNHRESIEPAAEKAGSVSLAYLLGFGDFCRPVP